MNEDVVKHNIQVLGQLARWIVGERYKQMARDEVLSKFMSLQVDPILLVDMSLQLEREAIHLAEISLLALVTPDKMQIEARKSAKRIQDGYVQIYGEENPVVRDFSSPSLLQLRQACIRARVDFYNPFLSIEHKGASPKDLAYHAYLKSDRFQKKVAGFLEADRRYGEELVRQTEQLHRFMMKKQVDVELSRAEALWSEFQLETFKEPQALP